MDPARWAIIEELFHAASELPAGERPALLDGACHGDAALRAEIDALLETLDDADDVMSEAVGQEAGRMVQASCEGQTIGAYRVVKRVGRGGMGEVFLAVRADDQYEKQVAIKVIRTGWEGRGTLTRRFLNERQILASLEHPNIARLLDGGVTADGLPYLVMEFVEGLPVDTYAEDGGLDAAARLRLFLGVCDAVAYAHRSMIIHRDLKPSNVLVDSAGTVKLLDFGIARITRPEAGSLGEMTMTIPAERMLTPDYASPEMLRGERPSTSVDVYSLGVILYELLARRRPFQHSTASLFEVERTVMHTEPARPSAVEEGLVQKLDRDRRLDLDAIIAKAMRKQPEERYTSVEALAADVERYLRGFPVRAREGNRMYEAGKFVRRHRLSVAAATLFVVTVTGLGSGMAVFAARAARERDVARGERSRAELVSSFLTSLFAGADPREARGATLTARDLLDRGAKRITTGLEQQPEVKSRLLATMGEAYQHLGLLEQAETLFTEELELERRARGARSPAAMAVLRQLADIQRMRGNYTVARANLRSALEGLRAEVGPGHPEVAQAANNLALIEQTLGNPREAIVLFQEAIRITARQPGEEAELLTMRSNLAGALLETGELEAAEAEFRAVLVRRTELLGADHPQRIRSMLRLTSCLIQTGGYLESEQLLAEAIPLSVKVWGTKHRDTLLLRIQWAELHWRLFADPKSGPAMAEIVRQAAAELGPEHPDTAKWRMRAAAVTAAPTAEVAAECQAALELIEKREGARSSGLARGLEYCGEAALRRNDFAGAARLAGRGLELRRQLSQQADHPDTARLLALLGQAEYRLGERAEARRNLREAVRMDRATLHRQHLQTADDLVALGGLLPAVEGASLVREGQAMRRAIVSSMAAIRGPGDVTPR